MNIPGAIAWGVVVSIGGAFLALFLVDWWRRELPKPGVAETNDAELSSGWQATFFGTREQLVFTLKNIGLPRNLGLTTCFVTAPNESTTAAFDGPGAMQFDQSVRFNYPRDFGPRALTSTPGLYRVRWETRARPSDSPTVLSVATFEVSMLEAEPRRSASDQSNPIQAEIQAQRTRPEVILRYEPPLFSAIRPDEAPTTPLLIQNAGDKPARQIEIDPVFFHGYVARFQPPTELVQNEPAREVQVSVTSTDDDNTQGDTLGFALDHDFWHRAWKGDSASSNQRWPISLRYRDAIGTAYEDVFELAYDHPSCRVTLGLRARQ